MGETTPPPPPLPTSTAPPPLLAPLPATTARRPQPRREEDLTPIWVGLIAIISLFLAFGLAWVLFADNIPWADADFYFRGAKSLAEGEGYRHPFRADHPPTAFHPVGYPWFLAHVWRLFGIDTSGCVVSSWPELRGCDTMIQAGQIANLLLATLNISLVFALGTLMKGPRIGLLSAMLFAIIPSRFLFTSAIMSEESFVALVLLALIMVVLSVRRQDWAWATAIGFGLAVGMAAFIRPLGIVLLALPLVLLFSHAISLRVAFTQLAIGAFVAFAILLPWEIRNHNEVGGWSLVSNNGGINLWIGCHLDHHGRLDSNGQWMDWWSGEAPRSLNTPDERANDSEAQRLALECMREQPFAFARLSLVKALYTFREDWTYVNKWALNYRLPERPVQPIVSEEAIDALTYLTNGVYLVLLPLAAVGAITTLFAPSVYRGLLGAAFAVLALIPLAFFGEPRFHVPLFPMMSIWAAEGIWVVARGLRSASREAVEAPVRQEVRERAVPYEWREEPWLR